MLPQYNNLDSKFFDYSRGVLTGRITACQTIKQACMRYESWFDDPTKYFDSAKAEKIITFIEHLKHFKSPFAGVPFKLMEWQKFLLFNIFCWVRADDHTKRIIEDVFLLISRKSSKTATTAAIALASMVCDNEHGGETYVLANSRDQAKVAFEYCSKFAKSVDPNRKHFRHFRDYLTYDKLDSKIKCLASDSSKLDGLNPSFAIIDEYHEAKSNELVEVMKSGMMARRNPLTCIISSAGFNLDGYPCYEMYKLGKRVLSGEVTDDSSIYLIYELDEGDDYRLEENWLKCNPSYGVIASKEAMEKRVHEAEINPMNTNAILTKNFNKFCAQSVDWLTPDIMNKVYRQIDLEQLRDETCYVALDLSDTRDLTALSLFFPRSDTRSYYPDKHLFYTFYFIPRYAFDNSQNSPLYRYWHSTLPNVYVTPGKSIDHASILKKIKELFDMFTVAKIGYDRWHATMLVQMMQGEGMPCEVVSQSIANFTRPTQCFEIFCCQEECYVNDEPVMRWMMNNVEIKEDYNHNRKPVKAGDNKLKKIDGVISELMSLSGYMLDFLMPEDLSAGNIPLNEVMSGIL